MKLRTKNVSDDLRSLNIIGNEYTLEFIAYSGTWSLITSNSPNLVGKIASEFIEAFASEYGYTHLENSTVTLTPILLEELRLLIADCLSYREDATFSIGPSMPSSLVSERLSYIEKCIETSLNGSIDTINLIKPSDPTNPLNSPMDWGFCLLCINLEKRTALFILASAMVG